MRLAGALALATALVLVGACGKQPYRVANLAKSDINFVADAHQAAITELLDELTAKLYRRNPRELRKQPGASIESRRSQLFDTSGRLQFEELDYREEVDAILLGLDPGFSGDRVFAVMTGLTGMLRRAYNYQDEFFILHELDQQRLYNSARNIEILVWRLKHRTDDQGELLLLTNSSAEDDTENLSFERLFGKLIAIQDLLARITADRTNRTITKVVHSVATATFLP